MGFILKEDTSFETMLKEVEYLNEIGVRYISGKQLDIMANEVIVDESKNAYLINTGMHSPNIHGVEQPIYYYSFCKDRDIYKLELTKNDRWDIDNGDIDINWTVKIDYIPNEVVWKTNKVEICEMIKEALKIEVYSYGGKSVKKEFYRNVCINVLHDGDEG